MQPSPGTKSYYAVHSRQGSAKPAGSFDPPLQPRKPGPAGASAVQNIVPPTLDLRSRLQNLGAYRMKATRWQATRPTREDAVTASSGSGDGQQPGIWHLALFAAKPRFCDLHDASHASGPARWLGSDEHRDQDERGQVRT